MALNGTLEELGVLDVVQFVNHAHLSGALALKSGSDDATLFYRKGGLVHARLGQLTGLEVLVRIVDWTSGTFAFQPGTDSPEETIRMDLHRAVMYALKTRDERKLEAEKTRKESQPQKPSLAEELAQVIQPLEFVQQATIFDATGPIASAARKGGTGDDLAPVCKALLAFNATYPRGRFRRAIFDDEKGTMLVSALQRNRWLVVVAEKGAALGAVTVGMGRLVGRVEALGSNQQSPRREALASVV